MLEFVNKYQVFEETNVNQPFFEKVKGYDFISVDLLMENESPESIALGLVQRNESQENVFEF